MNKKVLFIDSGIGGLSTLASCLHLCPTLSYIYVADTKNAPYGNKTSKQIRQFLLEIINEQIKTNNIGIIVLACNTATSCAIDYLREIFPTIIFIGTEPAIKPAIKSNMFNAKILVLATKATCNQPKFKKLIAPYKKDIILCPSQKLASLIESYFLKQTPKTFNAIKQEIFLTCLSQNAQNANISSIVLGCTHYSLIAPIFKELFNTKIIDGNFGVAKMLLSLVSLSNENYYCPTKIFPIIKQTAPTRTPYHKILNNLLK